MPEVNVKCPIIQGLCLAFWANRKTLFVFYYLILIYGVINQRYSKMHTDKPPRLPAFLKISLILPPFQFLKFVYLPRLSMLIAQSIQKYYGDLHVLKGVNVSIQKGEIVSIVGASGAGKSTLLHILGTLDKADSGTLEVEGLDILKLTGDRLATFRNDRIGFIFQFHNLLPEFTAEENIWIPGLMGKKPENALKKRTQDLAKLLGIQNRLSHKPAALSGGEQQRVAVARALVNNPDMIFADEPSGNLDTQNAQSLHELFFKLRDEFGQSFVIVTHNQSLAGMSDRMLTMEDGKILA